MATIVGNRSNNTLIGTQENDLIRGKKGNDILNGGLGNDTLNGGMDHDTLIGSVGHDILNGNKGNDTADYSSLGHAITLKAVGVVNKGSAGNDTIIGIETIIGAIGQSNAIDGSTGSGNVSFDVDLSENRLTVEGIPSIGDVTFTVENFVNVTGTSNDDEITGNNEANKLFGRKGNDYLYGEGGNDRLRGNEGHDYLYGESGNDRLFAGKGDDYLDGGTGNDRLTGGDGSDEFYFYDSFGHDTIVDFNENHDRIVLSGLGITEQHLGGGDDVVDASDPFVTSVNNGIKLNLTSFGGGTIKVLGVHQLDLSSIDIYS